MIDVHCHILPGLDDGCADIEISLDLARAAVKEGIDTIVATPHCIPEVFFNQREQVLKVFKELQDRLLAEKIPLTIVPGMEVHLTLDVAQRLVNGTALTMGDQGKYVLLELPANSVPSYAEQVIFEIMLKGIRPILAHPERNKEIIEHPSHLQKLIEKGCLVQVTSYSLTGQFGSKIQDLAKQMLKLGWVDFIASDAHGPAKRPVALKEAYQVVQELVGEDVANQLVRENAQRILAGQDVVKRDIRQYYVKRKKRSKGRAKKGVFGMKKLAIVVAIIGVLGIAGYLAFNHYFLNPTSSMDAKSKEEQKQELLHNDQFKDLPEVKELKEQTKQLENNTAKPEQVSQAEIENNLRQKLSSLQGEYNGRIGGLIASARQDYIQIASGQKGGSKSALAKKYLGLANQAEAECDARVYAAIATAEEQLAEYGYHSNVTDQARAAYQQAKKARRQQLLSKL